MFQKIKRNEYVRTLEGEILYIYQVCQANKSLYSEYDSPYMELEYHIYGLTSSKRIKTYTIPDKDYENTFNTYFKKHSSNLSDLVEIGDYNKGKKIDAVVETDQIGRMFCYDIEYPIDYGLKYFTDKDISELVTKEQYERITFKPDKFKTLERGE